MLKTHLESRKATLELLNSSASKSILSKQADIERMEREIADRESELIEIEEILNHD